MLDAAKVCQLLLQRIIHRPRCSAAFIQRKEPMCFVQPPVNAGTFFFLWYSEHTHFISTFAYSKMRYKKVKSAARWPEVSLHPVSC